MKNFIFIVCLIFCWNCNKTENSKFKLYQNFDNIDKLNQKDVEEILQKVLNNKNVNQYFHHKNVLIYSKLQDINSHLKLTFENQKVVVLDSKKDYSKTTDILRISDIELKNNAVKVEFSYNSQGMVGTVRLKKKNNIWNIVTKKISEV